MHAITATLRVTNRGTSEDAAHGRAAKSDGVGCACAFSNIQPQLAQHHLRDVSKDRGLSSLAIEPRGLLCITMDCVRDFVC